MKNILLFLFVVVVGALFVECSEDGELTPTFIDRDRYNVSDFSSQEEMEIRNRFYEETGCFLVFNDSLAKREAVTPAGIYIFVDTIDLNYAASSRTQHKFDYTKLSTIEEKEAAADFLLNEVLTRMDTIYYPYSFFMVDSLIFTRYMVAGSMISYRDPIVMGSWVCYSTTIVACNGVFDMDAEERESYVREVQKGMVLGMYTQLDPLDYVEFYNYSADYYEDPYEYLVDENWEELGFIPNVWVNQEWYTQANDVPTYIWEIFSMTKEEFDKKYGQWSIVLNKRDAMVRILERHGIKVY